jgi:6-phosphogluconolactonase (cycloisomerase 2 family)
MQAIPHRRRLILTAIAMAAALAACGGSDSPAIMAGTPPAPPPPPPLTLQLYTQTNETANTVLHFTRAADGKLTRKEASSTGGMGTNAVRANGTTGPNSLGSQFSVIVSPDNKQLFVANGGDSSISVMAIDQATGALTIRKNSKTAGQTPNSLAYSKGYLYASFLRGAKLAAYRVEMDGALSQVGLYDIAAGTGLAASSIAPTQLVVSPDGKWLIVSAGTGTNAVLSYPMNADGTLGAPLVNNTQFATPFAGLFVPGLSSQVYLSTGITGVSLTSYTLSQSGMLTQLNQAAATGVGAPCWLAITPNGKFAFVGNGSGSISSYAIAANGTVSLLQSVAAEEPSVLAGVNSVAGDSWVSPDGKFLYSTYLGADKVVVYAIAADGKLNKVGETPVGTSTRLSLQGLAGV